MAADLQSAEGNSTQCRPALTAGRSCGFSCQRSVSRRRPVAWATGLWVRKRGRISPYHRLDPGRRPSCEGIDTDLCRTSCFSSLLNHFTRQYLTRQHFNAKPEQRVSRKWASQRDRPAPAERLGRRVASNSTNLDVSFKRFSPLAPDCRPGRGQAESKGARRILPWVTLWMRPSVPCRPWLLPRARP